MLYSSDKSFHFYIVLVFNSSARSSMSLCLSGVYSIFPYNISASFSILWDSFIIPASISTASLHVPYSHLSAALNILRSWMPYLFAISSQYRSLTQDLSPYSIWEFAAEFTMFLQYPGFMPFPLKKKLFSSIAFFFDNSYYLFKCPSHPPSCWKILPKYLTSLTFRIPCPLYIMLQFCSDMNSVFSILTFRLYLSAQSVTSSNIC